MAVCKISRHPASPPLGNAALSRQRGGVDERHETTRGIPAATVVVFRHAHGGGDPQILLTVRSRQLAFAGGMAVFPGGRVDPADRELADRLASDDADEAAHRIAAIRETLEETGLVIGVAGDIDAATACEARAMLAADRPFGSVIDRFGWRLDLATIVPFARWFPQNEGLTRIFDTRFYLADIGTGAVDLAVAEDEATHLFWTSAREALAMADRGEIGVIFPTRRNLERLAGFTTFGEARDHALDFPVRPIIPFVGEVGGRRSICIPDDAGYPVTSEPLDQAKRQ
nr:NUDIX domain-containing protein [Erythrobacter sp. LQ02-29]